jgi:DNA polymerase-4
MNAMGLFTGADLKKLTEEELVRHFGKAGRFYFKIVRGVDERPVEPHQETKSNGAEDTFAQDLVTIEEKKAGLEKIAQIVHKRLSEHKLIGRTVTIKIRFHDFRQITRSRSFSEPISDLESIGAAAKELLLKTEPEGKRIRLLGITISNLDQPGKIAVKKEESQQLPLFT